MADQATRYLRVWRGDKTGGGLADYTVAVHEGEVVLDVLHRLQATQAGDLAIRWNCKAGKCGSCSAEINGRPKLLCMTRLSALPPGPITITPLRTFPVLRDLVTDVSASYDWALRVPSFAPADGLKPGEYRMRQADVDRSQEFRKCIECWLCQDVCHVIRDHEDNNRPTPGPGTSSGTPSWTCTRSTPATGAACCASGRAWACATSPSAAPRSARPGSRSPTTGSSR